MLATEHYPGATRRW